MARSLFPRRVAVATLLLALAPLYAAAQTTAKPPRRLPPNASDTSRIPAGVDTGSPVTSDSVPLGTPVPPNASADRAELKTRSAAARAAARPKPAASAGDCTRLVAASSPAGDGTARPVALPKSGFTGSSTSPSNGASAGARTPTRLDC